MPAAEPGIALLVPDLPDAHALLPWLQRIDAHRWYTNGGPLLQELESLLSRQWPSLESAPATVGLNVVALNSGTAALELAIMALALPAGAAVLMPSFTFPATASAAMRAGLKPVFADVSHDRWQLEPDAARAIAAQQTIALVMPVATFGCPVDVAGWDAFVTDTGIPVLIDAAGAFGQQAVGERTHFAFSLHATKPFGIGEGGLFASRDGALAERVRCLANFGFDHGQVTAIGSNGKLSEYAAAVALAQWQRWPALRARRHEQWQRFLPMLGTLSHAALQAGFSTSAAADAQTGFLPSNLVLRLRRPAADVRDALAAQGIESRRWYCPPLHRQPAFANGAQMANAPSNTDVLAAHALGLPWHTRLTDDEMSQVVEALRRVS